MDPCVDRRALDLTLSGDGGATRDAEVLAHVGRCDECRSRFEEHISWRTQRRCREQALQADAQRSSQGHDRRRGGRNIIVLLLVISGALHFASRERTPPPRDPVASVVLVSPVGPLEHRPRIVEVRHPVGTTALLLEILRSGEPVLALQHRADPGDTTLLPFPDRDALAFESGFSVRVSDAGVSKAR